MKIITVGMNYVQYNRELGHTQVNREPVIFTKPDSTILRNGKPFFVPDFSAEVHYETEVVVRICRLGKNVASRFTHRYHDAMTVRIDFIAHDPQRKFHEADSPWKLCKGFDNSAVIGTFIPLEQAGGDLQQLNFHLDVDGKEVQRGDTSDMLFEVDDTIVCVDCSMTLKTDDLLFTGIPAGVGSVGIGQHLQGYLGEEKLLGFYIR